MTRSSKTNSASQRRSNTSSSHSSSSTSYPSGQHSSTANSYGNPGSYAQPSASGTWYPASNDSHQQMGSYTNSRSSSASAGVSYSQASVAGSFAGSSDQPRLQEPGWSPEDRAAYAQRLSGPASRAQPQQRSHEDVLSSVRDLGYGYGQQPSSTQTYHYARQLDDDFGIPSSSRQGISSSRRDTPSRPSRRRD
ncbi:hypothetical protein JMJ77_0015214 [Colletotrichum scovillei]|uniref:Uncharacterized protein n=2 Tax=Colletotrichum scovillei TaxID=1209932 RepID=A0A9P7QZT0_9PEZI|nr:hypothetical protein JMJ77_0015214 [Colletotrichum scovillei]KAG7056835.1 hypothetical protein JMJ78_0000625 [Colletotrichum scovillei]KAG7066764.1 hypothetical protein JMJ76_0000616 [Colletotrichum scovillei]